MRQAALGRHGGQISLPGGCVDAGETTADAARRELAEELGVGESIELVGELPPCYVYVSNFLVTPWLATIRTAPVWRPRDCEVEQVVEMPLSAPDGPKLRRPRDDRARPDRVSCPVFPPRRTLRLGRDEHNPGRVRRRIASTGEWER